MKKLTIVNSWYKPTIVSFHLLVILVCINNIYTTVYYTFILDNIPFSFSALIDINTGMCLWSIMIITLLLKKQPIAKWLTQIWNIAILIFCSYICYDILIEKNIFYDSYVIIFISPFIPIAIFMIYATHKSLIIKLDE